jgi:hypothetical protein
MQSEQSSLKIGNNQFGNFIYVTYDNIIHLCSSNGIFSL